MALEIVEPIDLSGRPLSPYDAHTGMPLPVLPVDHPNGGHTRTNNHHQWFEHAAFAGSGNPGLQALCYSRLQHGPQWVHWRYHHFFAGTLPPESVDDTFRLTVLSQVYVPEWAVDVSGNKPRIVRPNIQQEQALRAADTWRIERRPSNQAKIGMFLMNYAIMQDLPEEQRALIDEFLSIKPRMARRSPEIRARKERLAARVLGKSLEVALEPTEQQFQVARKQERLKEQTPPSSWLVVSGLVGNFLRDYFRTAEIRHRLAGQATASTLLPQLIEV